MQQNISPYKTEVNKELRNKMKSIFLLISLFIVSLLHINAVADETKEKSMEELSKEISSPLAQIWNLSFQYNYYLNTR